MRTFIVAVALEEMCKGGPEEGGWWYDYGEPSMEPEHLALSKAFTNEEEAYEYVRWLNANVVPNFNEEWQYEYESVCGGFRYTAWIWENEMPQTYFGSPGCHERPRYE